MTTVLLIRHGDNDYLLTRRLAGLTPGVHLNGHGRIQAHQLAKQLSQLPIEAIYSSPLERAIETAEPLASAKNIEMTFLNDLIEINPGDWTGSTVSELRASGKWRFSPDMPDDFQFPNGDKYLERQGNLITAINTLQKTHTKGTLIACFSHADTIKLCLAHYLNMSINAMHHLNIPPASISRLALDGDLIQVGPIGQVTEIEAIK
jgi:broad specificity phosphatase PhoE